MPRPPATSRANPHGVPCGTPWHELSGVAGQVAGFESIEQASALIPLVFDSVLPGYRKFHGDLLAHQSEESLFQPYFIAKACQATLAQEGPWSETTRIVEGAIDTLNDFIGHRPVAVLRTAQKIEPYRHEWVCPLPLFIAGAGVASGRYHDLIAAALEVLRSTDRALLDKAYFDPDHLQELASIRVLMISIIRPTSDRTIISASGTRTRLTTRAITLASYCRP